MAKPPEIKVPVRRQRNCSCNSCADENVRIVIDQVSAKDPDEWLADLDALAAEKAKAKVEDA